jgi:hypothetical protein
MDQQAELAKVKARIRALAAKTVDRGCSEAEALAAAAKVGELLDVYGLSMSEVALREEACIERRLQATGPGAIALRWLLPPLLRFCECRGWTDGRHTMVLFGLEPDVQMAEYLLHVVNRALAHEEHRYRLGAEYLAATRRNAPQSVLRSFRYGFADRVARRLDAMADERHAMQERRREAERGREASRALVLAKERKLEEGVRGLGVRLRTVKSNATVRDRNAFGRGAEAGGRVGLDRPMHGAAAAPGRLPGRA